SLKKANASDAAKKIKAAFANDHTNRNSVRVAADPATNSLLVRANPHDMLKVRELVAFVDRDNEEADPKPENQGRLGIHVQKPSAALADQLDLPKDQGLLIEYV